MANEIEAKHKVDDFAPIITALRKARARLVEAHLQTDRYFDTPDKRLLSADSGLRIRTLVPLAGRRRTKSTQAEMTFKGPRQKHKSLKVRREVQTHVADAEKLVEILTSLGFLPSMVVQKRRTTYSLGRCRVELDELPLIGKFVEIESASEAAIARVSRKLGLTGPSITMGYTRMLADRCRQLGLDCMEVRFDKE